MEVKPIKEISLSYINLEFYDSYVIATIKEDQIFEKDKIEELRKIFYDHFGHKKFVYISDRKYKYNVNPIIYLDLVQRNTLLGMALIIREIDVYNIANFEKQFAKVPFEMFCTKDEALVWAKRLLKEDREDT